MRKSPAGELGLLPTSHDFVPILHTEASGSIFAHFQIEQSGSDDASTAQWVIRTDLSSNANLGQGEPTLSQPHSGSSVG